MVSQDSPPNPASSMLHQFIVSDFISGQTQFENQNVYAYGSDLRGNHTFPQSLGGLPSIQSLGERMTRSIDLVQSPSASQEPKISHSRHLMDLLGAANETNHQAQRLSLSLGSNMLVPQVQYRHRSFDLDVISPNYLIPAEEASGDCNAGAEQVNNNNSSNYSFTGAMFTSSSLNRSSASYGMESFALAIGNSRYFKPAQSLLEETVNVSKAVDINNEKYVGKLFRVSQRGALGLSPEIKAELCSNELLSAEKHELQVKITKLRALLEEVEGRYEKYYHQMEEVVSSFEEIAGLGAAKSYTALALQAMSRHFCSLRDAIVSQINAMRRKFSQDLPKISSGLLQLSLFDRETRHNRMSLQQLGMIQSQKQVWRPIRGLPETSVTILRSWLFEHFLHPYPNDSEKLMLASQTGLTKNQVILTCQVSNWFINARVRLWKPMIEEMYKEEFADSSEESSNPLLGSSSLIRDGVMDPSED